MTDSRLTFQIHYKASYGEVMILVGDIPALGNWDVNQGFRLSWFPEDVWKIELIISITKLTHLQYKYVLCSIQDDILVPIRWENGPNRSFNILRPMKNYAIKDVWNYRTLDFRLKNQFETERISAQLIVKVNNSKFSKKMHLKTIKNESFWQAKIQVEAKQSHVTYCYVLYDKDNQRIILEREPAHKLFFSDILNKNNKIHKNMDKYREKNNTYIIEDYDFNQKFSYNNINEKIILGTIAQNEQEIETIKKQGVNAVLNLITKENMEKQRIVWEEIKALYEKKGIFVINHQISVNMEEDAAQILCAAKTLYEIVTKFKKVYIHSNSFVLKVPNIIMSYLYIFENYSFKEASEFLKSKMAVSNHKRCISKALLSFNQMKEFTSIF